jgi:hypothetical protein
MRMILVPARDEWHTVARGGTAGRFPVLLGTAALGGAALLFVLFLTAALNRPPVTPGSGGLGSYLEKVDCTAKSPLCQAIEAAVRPSLERSDPSHPAIVEIVAYAAADEDPASKAGQSVSAGVTFADEDVLPRSVRLHCWLDAPDRYRCEAR